MPGLTQTELSAKKSKNSIFSIVNIDGANIKKMIKYVKTGALKWKKILMRLLRVPELKWRRADTAESVYNDLQNRYQMNRL